MGKVKGMTQTRVMSLHGSDITMGDDDDWSDRRRRRHGGAR